MSKKVFIPQGAKIVGPYSPVVEDDESGIIFFSGQIPIDSQTGKIVDGGIQEQTLQCLKNLTSALEAARITSENILKTTIYLTEMEDYTTVNEIYSKYFKPPYPARTAIAVKALPLGSKVEIEVVAKR